MSPLDGSLYPDMEIPLPDDPFDALAGMSFQFDEDHTQFPMDGGVDTSPLRVPPVQSRGAGAVDELNVDLDRLASTVQSRLPRHEITQLYEMKDLLRVTFSRLEGMIQHQIDTLDHSPVSPSNGARYLCYLCPPQHRKMYGARGTFRRHVAYRHRPEFIYHCLDDNCLWKSTRRDKVYCHMRTNHRYPWRITREQIALAERRVAAPSVCGLCPNGVSCWADYFKCVSEHCRIQGNSSTSSSASQSRWGSDYRGAGGGFGSYGSQFPDGFGGNGSHSLFSHGTGNAGLGFFAPGQNPGSYGNGYSACVDEVNGPEDRSIQGHSASAADSVSPVSTPYFRASGEPEIASPVPSNLARYHSSLMQGAFPTNHQNIDPVQSNDSRSSQPDESKTDESPRWISRSPNRDRSPKQKPGPEKDQHEKRCESCGHDCDNCNMCHSKETVSQCHMCADMAREAYQEPEHSTTRDWILYENEPPAPTKWDLDSQFLIQADRLGDHRDVTCDLQEQVDPELDKSHRFENTMQKTLNVDSLFSGLPAGLVFNTAITRSVAMKLHASFLQAVYPVLDDTQKTVKIPHDNDLPLTKTRTKTPSETQLQHVTYRVLSIYVPHVEQLFFGQKGPSVSYEADVSHSVSSFCGACMTLFHLVTEWLAER
ncbi:hypothetical protein BO70DRAFT_36371 [Aspergillus heteromorphus CBS 117.55]|uniref:C2H2-type domain-containing protein n=1 Tax=Aspergillus heteromorphus CBS 117.55 TaxID=1448321 RepID=A0A317W8X7_9EURO|nr:uncharacterized protein BO70DRAFT_36371 [Aspergillus heteromorphus CBS 117.55]PWY82191.1 hypothetical protein BO70DRAFT_36371 [Aspergillus heteromorphus CBS 117.55]